MNYPDAFDYFDTCGENEYTTSPTGQIDINRLVQNQAYWVMPTKAVKKHKHLVLTDWRARHWRFSQQEAMIDCCEQLIDEGFKLYLWTENTLIRCLKNDIESIFTNESLLSGIAPTTLDVVAKKAMEDYKIPREHLHCLDDVWVDYLIEGKNEAKTERILAVSHLEELSNEETKTLDEIFDNEGLGMILLDHPDYSSGTQIPQKFKKIAQKILYKQAGLSTEDIKCLKEKEYAALSQLTLYGSLRDAPYDALKVIASLQQLKTICIEQAFDFNKSHMKQLALCQQIEKITLSTYFTSKEVYQLLNAMPHLKEFKWSSEESMEPIRRFRNPFSRMKRIVLEIDAPQSVLQNILEASPNLVSLSLFNSEFSGSAPFKGVNFPHLVSLQVLSTNLSGQLINSWLHVSPKLRDLTLEKIDSFSCSLPPKFLSELKELTLSDIKISANSLRTLFMAAANMEQLDISSCQAIKDYKQLPVDAKLNQLTRLNLCRIAGAESGQPHFPYERFVDLLMDAPHLESLFIKKVPFSSSMLKRLEAGSLTKLKSIDLSDNAMELELVSNLIMAAPNIRYLRVYGKPCKWSEDAFPPNYLPNLETIKVLLHESMHGVVSLLRAAPNCQTLYAAFRDQETIAVHGMPDCKFSSVIYLKLSGISSISTDFLAYLAKTFPYLQKLDLEAITVECSTFSLTANSFPHLTELMIERGVSRDIRDGLLVAAPQLRRTDVPIYEVEEEQRCPNRVEYLDADTAPEETIYELKPIFYPEGHQETVAPQNYREEVYQEALLNPMPPSIDAAFIIQKTPDHQLIPLSQLALVHHQDYRFYRGHLKLTLTNEWQALPSLSAQERLLAYKVEPKNSVEVQYSLRDNQYFIRHVQKQRIKVLFEWTLSVPQLKHGPLPHQAAKWIEYVR